MTAPIVTPHAWRTNAELIAAVHELGYIDDDDTVLDPTYGNGRWWTTWRPQFLVRTDANPAKSPGWVGGADFTYLPFADAQFGTVAFDPPYKLNGTATPSVDEPYGVESYASHTDRHDLIRRGMVECARVLRPGGVLLVKCQDQVCGGRVRWQTLEFSNHGQDVIGLQLVDRLDMIGGRPQPSGRRQVHARRNSSTMLVFRKPKPRRTRGLPS